MTLVIACIISASAGCAFGFIIGALVRGGSDRPSPVTPRPPTRMDITLHGLDGSGMYGPENLDALLKAIEHRCADGRVLNIKVA
jgi:hypothetical protein